MIYYLYLLPCLDKKHMKIGVSSGDIKRIITHHKSYNIIMSGVRIFNCKTDRNIAYKVEKYLLDNIPVPKYGLKDKDGSSEIRELKYAESIVPLLNNIKKDPHFSYKESIYLEYKLYNLDEWSNYIKTRNVNIETQLEKLESPSKHGMVVSYTHITNPKYKPPRSNSQKYRLLKHFERMKKQIHKL